MPARLTARETTAGRVALRLAVSRTRCQMRETLQTPDCAAPGLFASYSPRARGPWTGFGLDGEN